MQNPLGSLLTMQIPMPHSQGFRLRECEWDPETCASQVFLKHVIWRLYYIQRKPSAACGWLFVVEVHEKGLWKRIIHLTLPKCCENLASRYACAFLRDENHTFPHILRRIHVASEVTYDSIQCPWS